jgi:hypothetical protein
MIMAKYFDLLLGGRSFTRWSSAAQIPFKLPRRMTAANVAQWTARSDMKGCADRVLLLGFAGAFRRYKLGALDCEDIEETSEGASDGAGRDGHGLADAFAAVCLRLIVTRTTTFEVRIDLQNRQGLHVTYLRRPPESRHATPKSYELARSIAALSAPFRRPSIGPL